MNRSTPGLPVHHQLLEFTQTHVHRVGDAIQPSHPLSSLSSPAPNPSQHQGLFQESTLHMRWPKYWSFSFSSSPSSEHPGLNSFRMDIVIKPPLLGNRSSLVAETVKNSPVVWETWVLSLGWKDPLEEGMATHCNILFWRIPMDRGPWWATVHGVAESEMTEWLSTNTY